MELREKRGGMGAGNGSGHGGDFFARGSRSTWDEIEKQPYFLPTTTVVTVQEGGHAFFICKVENLYNQTVSNNNQRPDHYTCQVSVYLPSISILILILSILIFKY